MLTTYTNTAHHLGIDKDTLGTSVPYLHVSNPQREQWQHWLQQANTSNRPIIALALAAGHGDEKWDPRIRRSIPVSVLAPLARAHAVTLFSFNAATSEKEKSQFKELGVHTVPPAEGAPFLGFTDVAAVLSLVKMCVGVDTVHTHIAGAVGTKTFLALPPDANWRCGLDDTTPWYPNNMKLIRQRKPEDYEYLGEQITNAVKEELNAQ